MSEDKDKYLKSLAYALKKGALSKDDVLKALDGAESKEEKRWPPAVVSNTRDFAARKFKESELLLCVSKSGSPVLYHPSAGEVHAKRGVGKSNWTLGLLTSLATGGEFLAYKATRPFRVLYVDGELSGSDLQDMLHDLAVECENFNVLAVEEQPEGIPSIAFQLGLDWLEEACVRLGVEVLALDSWSTLAGVGTNEEDTWLAFMAWAAKMRRRGVTVIFLHHDGKSGTQRGHSRSEDLLNWVIQLFWSGGYFGAEGLKCTMHFEKARKPVKECSTIDIELVEDEDGKYQWLWRLPQKDSQQTEKSKGGRPAKELTEEEADRVAELLKTDSVREAAKKSGISRSRIERWAAKNKGPKQKGIDFGKKENNDHDM